jgi:hypothetical protein
MQLFLMTESPPIKRMDSEAKKPDIAYKRIGKAYREVS